MSVLKFKAGDVVADDLGVIGEILSVNPDGEFPYWIREVAGGAGYHVQSDTMHLADSTTADPVNHPSHYTNHPSGIECIQVTEHMGFNLGNAIKYVWRADLKGSSIEDLRKAIWYIDREIQKREKA